MEAMWSTTIKIGERLQEIKGTGIKLFRKVKFEKIGKNTDAKKEEFSDDAERQNIFFVKKNTQKRNFRMSEKS